MNAQTLRRITIGALMAIALGGGLWMFFTPGRTTPPASAAEGESFESKPISVMTVHPKRDKDFQITVDRPANVEAYYRADLEAQVAGEVNWIHVARGSLVKRGEPLVRLFVPEKTALLHQKQSQVLQQEREYDLMREKKRAAEQAVKTAQSNVKLKDSLVTEAKSLTKFREVELRNAQALFLKQSIEEIVRDQAVKNLEYAQAAEAAANAARIKAEQEVEDARANVRVVEADVERVKQLIEEAKSERDFAAAIVGFSEVKAPFDGAVVSRHVDPGSFVQNASTGRATPLLTVERSDIVTVVMRVPDEYAPYISPGAEAVIEIDKLPGVVIKGKVTRYAPSLVTAENDRTMRVEVDLWNEAPDKYQAFMADPKNRAELKDSLGGQLPLVPQISGNNPHGLPTHLYPGMYGKMTLILQPLGKAGLIPSKAIVREGGTASIYVVQQGKAHSIPVQVQVDDGTTAHVLHLGARGEILGELAENEEVVVTNQEELSQGQALTPTLQTNWGQH